MLLLFIHGIAQKGKSESSLKTEWLSALKLGAAAAGIKCDVEVLGSEILQPFYGDCLYGFAVGGKAGMPDDVMRSTPRGGDFDQEFTYELQDGPSVALPPRAPSRLAEDEPRSAKLPEDDLRTPVTLESLDEKERSVYANLGVVGLSRFLDGKCKKLSRSVVDFVLPEVRAYLTNLEAMQKVDEIVTSKVRKVSEEIVVVGHSLGAAVALRVLNSLPSLKVAHLITVGGPLGVGAVTRRIALSPPIKWPSTVAAWTNFLDKRDLEPIRELQQLLG